MIGVGRILRQGLRSWFSHLANSVMPRFLEYLVYLASAVATAGSLALDVGFVVGSGELFAVDQFAWDIVVV